MLFNFNLVALANFGSTVPTGTSIAVDFLTTVSTAINIQ